MPSLLALLSLVPRRASSFQLVRSAASSYSTDVTSLTTRRRQQQQQHPLAIPQWQQQQQQQKNSYRPFSARHRTFSSARAAAAVGDDNDDTDNTTNAHHFSLPWNRTAIRRLRVAELREELTRRGLESTGVRDVLLRRLLEAVFGATDEAATTETHPSRHQTNSTAISKPTLPTSTESSITSRTEQQQPPSSSTSSTTSTTTTTQLDSNRLYVLRFRGHTNTSYSNAGVGLVLYDVESQKEVWSGRKYFYDEQSRFEAEYKGIAIGLKIALQKGVQRLVLQGDNHVILKQLEGSFNVKKEALQRLYWTTVDLKEQFKGQFEMQPINGAENHKAKALASRAVATKKSHNLEGQDKWQKSALDGGNSDDDDDDDDSASGDSAKEDDTQDAIPQLETAPPVPSSTGATNGVTPEQEDAYDDDEYAIPDSDERAPYRYKKQPDEETDDGTETASPIDPTRRYLMRFDGGSRGNPGLAGAGMVIYDDTNKEVWCGWKYLEHRATNNDAEYTGLIVGLKCALSLGITNLKVEGDSELIVRQLEGRYQVKEGRLRELWTESKELIPEFDSIEIRHIPRALNKRADELANAAMDSQESFGFEDTAE